jgi:photosystem I P700 chlorophyll a apoprotein A1
LPIVGQEILNGDVGGNFQVFKQHQVGFQMWRAEGITSEVELYWLQWRFVMSQLCYLLVGSTIIKAAPNEWFQNAESMMNHHLAGLLGLGCLSWSGHQIHIALPINKLLDAGVAPQKKFHYLMNFLLINESIIS